MQRPVLIVLLGAVASSAGCATYTTPAGGVPMAELADQDLQSFYAAEPVSPFPANLAVLRVQDAGYATRTSHGYGEGRYTVVTTRDIESDEAFVTIGNLPLVSAVAPVGRLLLPSSASTLEDLRAPAAKLRADLLLVYSVDTTFIVEGQPLGPLSLVSLGFIPNKKAQVTATVAGALIDVRTGFIYGTAEATARQEQRASLWSTEEAIDTARLEAEQQAFGSFVGEFGKLWSSVVEEHADTTRQTPRPERQAESYYRVRFDCVERQCIR